MREKFVRCAIFLMLCLNFFKINVEAKDSTQGYRIADGVYAGEVNLSGMTKDEAYAAITEHISSAGEAVITLEAVDGNRVETSAYDIGIFWENTDIVDKALNLGKKGNVIKRYKECADLKHDGAKYDIDLSFDAGLILELLETRCQPFDVSAKDFCFAKNENELEIVEGVEGRAVNVEGSLLKIQNFLENEWNHENATIPLMIDTIEPRGSIEELRAVKDVLGQFETSYATSGKERTANVENGCRLINGVTLYPGDEFSTLVAITPFTEENGYKLAASYLNGLVVESLGGGICQVSTTLYNAVLLAELETTQRNCHSMIVNYVKPSMDAAIAESSGKDFRFRNNTDYPIYIDGITKNRKICFTIYGVETRPETHKVIYESEVLETKEPGPDKIITTTSEPVGYVNISAAHTGYKAQLWKIVMEDGVEVSRKVINKSTYNMAPRTATVGIATNNPDFLNVIKAAVATGNIDYVKAIANQLKIMGQ